MPSDPSATIGATALDTMASAWQADPEWVASLPNGFSWWAHRLEQQLTYKNEDDPWVSLAAVTLVIRHPRDPEETKRILARLNEFSGSFAFTYDAADDTVKAVTSARMPGWYFPSLLWFSEAAMVQLACAEKWADPLTQATGGTVATTRHPSGRLRPEPDDMLSIVSSYRHRAEWVTGGIEGYSVLDALAQRVQDGLELESGPGEYELDRWLTGFRFPLIAGASQPPFQVEIERDSQHPVLGSGLQLRLTTVGEWSAQASADIVNNLNRATAMHTPDLKGAWWAASGRIGYASTLPGALLGQLSRLAGDDPSLTDSLDSLIRFTILDKPSEYDDEVEALRRTPKATSPEMAETAVDAEPGDLIDAGRLDLLRSLATELDARWTADTVVEALDEPGLHAIDPDLVLATFGIFNPIGPTLTTLGICQVDINHYVLLEWMRHPFSPSYRAHLTLADLRPETLATALDAVLVEPYVAGNGTGPLGNLPEFIDLTQTPDEIKPVIEAAFTSAASRGGHEDVWAQAHEYEAYAGHPWPRLNQELGKELPTVPQAPDDPTAAARWLSAVTDPDHVALHRFYFPSAWDGAIEFLRSASEDAG